MPTKDELVEENKALKTRNDLLDAANEEMGERIAALETSLAQYPPLEAGKLYKWSAEQDALVEAEDVGDTVAGESAARIEELTKELTASQLVEQGQAKEIARLRAALADQGSLHGSIDSLKPPY